VAGRDAAAYLGQLFALLPPGIALPDDADSVLGQLLATLAEEFARVDVLFESMLDEADPRTALLLLAEWERAFGLPDPCAGPPATVEGRRAVLVERVTNEGNLTGQYIEDAAALLGFSIVITEDPVGAPFVFTVSGSDVSEVVKFRAGSSVAGERLGRLPGMAFESGELVFGRLVPTLAVGEVDHEGLERPLRPAMDGDHATGTGRGMEDAGLLAIFEEHLAALHGLPFFHVHARLHAREVVSEHRDPGAGRRASHHLEGFAGDGEVEALLDLMQ